MSLIRLIHSLLVFLVICAGLEAQTTYTVNSTNDVNDGKCDGVHCSLREAIIAANTDGLASKIVFAIPGAGTQIILPTSALPDITQNNLEIAGETQNGSLGNLVVEFNFLDLMQASYLNVQASQVKISGIIFKEMRYVNAADHIISFGSATVNADRCELNYCSFQDDNTLTAVNDMVAVKINQANNLKVKNCLFGADFARSQITKTFGSVSIESSQAVFTSLIDSCYFVNANRAITCKGGVNTISNSYFGALDTSKTPNFLGPNYGILLEGNNSSNILNNYFYGDTLAVRSIDQGGTLTINNNYFHSCDTVLYFMGSAGVVFSVNNNRAKNGKTFCEANVLGSSEINLTNNNVSDFNLFYNTSINSALSQSLFDGNTINCITQKVVNNIAAGGVIPVPPAISGVNRNAITGTALPNHVVTIYANARRGCLNAVCQGGNQLGTTIANSSGNWSINIPYTNGTTISAYQHLNVGGRSHIYSEFSPCFTCTGPIKLEINPSICEGDSYTYRGKVYTSATPYDSIFVRGNTSVCDSIFIIKIDVAGVSRIERDVQFCYNDTAKLGSLKVYKNKLIDSVTVKSSVGCDSTTIIKGTEVGYFHLVRTICSNDSVRVGNVVFNQNNSSGVVVLANQSYIGCDSTVQVDLSIKNFAEYNLVRTICKNDTIQVGNTKYGAFKLTGTEVLPGASSTRCDSVINVFLTVANTDGFKTVDLCKGDSVKVENVWFSERNLQSTIKLVSYLNCDSSLTVNVNLLPDATGYFSADICRGDTLRFPDHPGQIFTSGRTTGTLRSANSAINGCDSLTIVTLTVIPDAIGNLDTSVCENKDLNIYGLIFNKQKTTGSLKLPIKSSRNCDSFLTVNVRIIPVSNSIYTQTICQNQSITIGNTVFNAANPSGIISLPNASAARCDSNVTVNISFFPPIQLNFSSEDLLCNKINTGEFNLSSITGGSGQYKISIDNSAPVDYNGNFSRNDLAEGSHTVRILDSKSCDTSFNFTINKVAILSLKLPNDTTIKEGVSVLINPSLNFIASNYSWDPPLGLSCTDCSNPTASPDQTTTYTLTAQDENGCEVKDQMTINVIVDQSDVYVPTVFSPNGDGLNDKFYPVFKFPLKTEVKYFAIFDRWGERIYEANNLGFNPKGEIYGWDGSFNQNHLNPGVFTYVIKYQAVGEPEKIKAGDITLLK
ncbi:MAG TPA: gliding motility-associated C-terminal domain-containing protein [Saprospiraceae bacterium]|nr:gliding motility-associated C-terminal domain-containing protein [Saprospiraceae bacterium]